MWYQWPPFTTWRQYASSLTYPNDMPAKCVTFDRRYVW